MKELIKDAINIYYYGSYVYGTFKEGLSDTDYIVVVPDDASYPEQIKNNNCDYNIYKEKDWIEMVKNNDIICVECEFLDEKFVVKKQKKYNLKIDKDLIRKNISSIASNSYVKCKKKLTVDESYNPRIGKKSLWHALRLLDFGCQIMATGKIYDYSSVNQHYDKIMNAPDDWNYLKSNYKPLYNQYKSEFKIKHNLEMEKDDYDR